MQEWMGWLATHNGLYSFIIFSQNYFQIQSKEGTPSPAIPTETIQHHLTRYLLSEPHIVKQLAESFYVDDFTSGVYSEEEGFKLYQRAKEIMLAGGFNLRKWRTNSIFLQQRITEVEEKSLNVAPSQKAKP